MSATSENNLQALLDLEKKVLKSANMRADTLLKEAQTRFEPWKIVMSALAAGRALVGVTAGATLLVAREL